MLHSPAHPKAQQIGGPDALQDDAAYRALQTRDARFDGRLFVGVTSTRIYCRPVCRVRPPKRENCRFFANAARLANAWDESISDRPGASSGRQRRQGRKPPASASAAWPKKRQFSRRGCR